MRKPWRRSGEQKECFMGLLTHEEKQFFKDNGYLVKRDVFVRGFDGTRCGWPLARCLGRS